MLLLLMQVVRTSIVECLDRLRGKVDVLLCNPPYVATDAGKSKEFLVRSDHIDPRVPHTFS